ncbi:MAG: hypothetical protein AAF620_19535, partial [Bacteroidota bacterium]
EEELIARIHEATGDAAEVIMTIASSLAPVPKVGLLKYARNLYKANKAMVAAKRGSKLLNQFNSVESLIQGAGKFSRVKGAQQAFIKGDGSSIFKAISQGSVGRTMSGGYILKDGTILHNHLSTKTGIYTIDIHRSSGQIFKIRVTP